MFEILGLQRKKKPLLFAMAFGIDNVLLKNIRSEYHYQNCKRCGVHDLCALTIFRLICVLEALAFLSLQKVSPSLMQAIHLSSFVHLRSRSFSTLQDEIMQLK